MKAASSNEIKNALKTATPAELMEICLRLARHKKENKELLTYLLFEADDAVAYIKNVKKDMEDGFTGINTSNLYFAKKSLRKVLRNAGKYIKFTGNKEAEAEILIHFCYTLKHSNIPFQKSAALVNLYNGQLKKAKAAIATLHEDLQYDYLSAIESL